MIDSWLPGVTTFTKGALKAQIRENSTLRVCVCVLCLSRHHHVTCDLLESHTGSTTTNTPPLLSARPDPTRPPGRTQDGTEDRELSIKPHRQQSCLCVFVCFCQLHFFNSY